MQCLSCRPIPFRGPIGTGDGSACFYLFNLQKTVFFFFLASFSSKSNEVNDWKQKLQNQAETFKLETTKKEEDILSKEQRIQQLLENCKNLEKRVVEYSQARSEVEEKSASSLEEIKVSCSEKNKHGLILLRQPKYDLVWVFTELCR